MVKPKETPHTPGREAIAVALGLYGAGEAKLMKAAHVETNPVTAVQSSVAVAASRDVAHKNKINNATISLGSPIFFIQAGLSLWTPFKCIKFIARSEMGWCAVKNFSKSIAPRSPKRAPEALTEMLFLEIEMNDTGMQPDAGNKPPSILDDHA
ncbi:hypothetical protein SLEP1_g3516 [Rubroshorea leprosula]|uniref:Uncharacterized protein n=1 Tax=Rubroshorea leprosula TaxID=152421 RepID=A0AAV5HT89_9ROSI|nr:hypothetical protein SLEP1_g3516 [Rubroshorea leprosula]